MPELKSSKWHQTNGHPIDRRFVEVTRRHSYAMRAPLHIQSFEVDNLKFLRSELGRPTNVKLVQLVGGVRERPQDHLEITYGDMLTSRGSAPA